MKANKKYPLVLAPVGVLVIVSAMFALYGIFPFGTGTVSWCDMNQQTVPLLMDFKDILEGKASIFYSTGNAGGMNFWGVFLFFLASPLYLLVKFVKKSDIIYLVNILLAVKLSLSAFTATVYLRYVHKRLHPAFVTLLSVMYALCGYGIMYSQTLVWLDMMVLFPLLMLGIHRMCLEGKPLIYGAALTASVLINYYISYMLVVFILLTVPLFIRMRCSAEQRKRAYVLFLWTSLIAALITAPVWLCAFLQVHSSARSGSTLVEFLYKPLFDNTADKLAILMFTAMFWAVIPLYFKSPLLKKAEVKYNFAVLLLLLVPVFLDPVNKIWHTGSYQCFPLRYGFVIIFTVMTLAAHFLESLEVKKDRFTPCWVILPVLGIGSAAVAVYIIKTKRQQLSGFVNSLNVGKSQFKIIFGLFILAGLIYLIGLLLYKQGIIGVKLLTALCAVVFIGEFYSSFSMNVGFPSNSGDLFKNSAVLVHDSSGEAYSRTKTEKKYLHVNMLGGLGYNSLAHYTSLTSESFMFAMKKLGYSSYWMEVGSNGGTVLTDALLGIKKSIGAYYDFKSYYEIENLTGDLEVGTSEICCPIGIKSSLSPSEASEIPDGKRVDTQKMLARKFFGTDSMISEYSPDIFLNGKSDDSDGRFSVTPDNGDMGFCQLRYSIPVKGRQVLYFDLFDRLSNDLAEEYYGSVNIYVDGSCIAENYPESKNNGIACLGEFCDTTAEILVVVKKAISVKSFGVFGIDVDSLKECTRRLTAVNGCDMYLSGNTITAECTAEQGEYLYLSVPYEKGLTAKVNGESAELIRTNDCFCALRLENGKNIIELSFLPGGMYPGLVLAFCGSGLLLLTAVAGKERICRIKALKLLSPAIARGAGILAFAAVYAAPVIVKMIVIITI